MAHSSPCSPRKNNPSPPGSIDTSTPWFEVFLGEHDVDPVGTPRILLNYARNIVRMFARSWNRTRWLAVFIAAGISWFLLGRLGYSLGLPKTPDHQLNMDGLQFIEANHPSIREQYVGRWLLSSDGTHKDASFPGVYFDFAINGSATVLLSLHNREKQSQKPFISSLKSWKVAFLPLMNPPNATSRSLLAKVDDDEYIVLPQSTFTIEVCRGNLDNSTRHDIRIVAPMTGDNITETLRVEGLWIDEGGQLLPIDETPNDEHDWEYGLPGELQYAPSNSSQKRMLEIVTDLPGSMTERDRAKSAGTGGVTGWGYLLGEMFGADHVAIGMDGMCLIRDCIGGGGSPIGLSDVFFQSGPAGSEEYAYAWHFREYTPDVMVMNIGSSDWDSFQSHHRQYNTSLWDLSVVFEDTYVSMIRAIRTLAYPKYSSTTVEGSYTYTASNAATGIPIFVMRPFRGELEQATRAVVERFQRDGDEAIFWLDTSGWLSTEVNPGGRAEDRDFFLDGGSSSKQWRLTERGNHRVAIMLHMHLCRYLARHVEECSSIPPENYRGKAPDLEDNQSDVFPEDKRGKKLKKMFWE